MLKTIFSLIFISQICFAQLIDNGQKVSYQINQKDLVQKFYEKFQVKEIWLKNPYRPGKYIAKVYSDPTTSIELRCDLIDDIHRTCKLTLTQFENLENVKWISEDNLTAVETYDKNVNAELWQLMNVPAIDHGGMVYKVLTDEENHFSIFCLIHKTSEPYVCKAQILK